VNRNTPIEVPVSAGHSGHFRGDLLVSAIVSILGGFLFGFDNIVISGAIRFLSRHFELGVIGTGWAASCALAGCIVGSSTIGMVVDRIGHKKSLFICTACFATSSVGAWIAHSLPQFVCWRVVGGLGIGAASILAPMYIAEIAPARLRGRLVTLYQAGIVLGILAAVFSNFLIQRLGDEAWNESVGWRLMFLVGLVPAALFGAMILPAVESPRWLFKMGRNDQALDILSRVDDPDQVESEARSIRASLQEEEGRFTELFTTYRRPLLLGIMLAGLQQISGITPIFAFLPEIFRAAGTARGDSFFQTVLVSVINLIFTFVGLWLVDTAGRRAIILAGTAVQWFALFSVGWLYHVHGSSIAILVFVMSFVAGHAVGNGIACWVLISEFYPTRVRGRAMSLATTFLWIVGFLGSQSFPVLMQSVGPAVTFWIFCAGALLTVILVGTLVPETKGRTLEQISHLWLRTEEGSQQS
jgi:SP family arabinose:H+ symporter-like MFS transporter